MKRPAAQTTAVCIATAKMRPHHDNDDDESLAKADDDEITSAKHCIAFIMYNILLYFLLLFS